MTPQQALDLAHDRPSACDDDLYDWSVDAENALRLMADRLMVAEELAAQYAAEAAHDAAQAVPAGFVLVPVEFIEAGQRVAQESAHEALALHRQRLESELSETRANVDKAPAAQSATVEEWERELSAVMPLDFKDWWQNDRHEWPAVAAAVIRSQRADCELGWKMAAEAAPSAEPLTDDDAYEIASEFFSQPWYRRVATEVVRATERAHGIGGATTGEQR